MIELANSLKSETKSICVSLIVPRNDKLNNKVNEVNSCLTNMCQQQNIKVVTHTNTIDPAKDLNENKLHLNKYGTIEFAKNFKNFLYNLNLRDLDNSEGFDEREASFANFVRNTLHSDHNENLSENGSEKSILFSEYDNNNDNKVLTDHLIDSKLLNPSKVLNDIHQMNSNRLLIAQLNINYLRNKFT